MPLLKDLFPTARKGDQPLSPRRKRSAVDLRRFVSSFKSTMSTGRPTAGQEVADASSLLVYVVLPPSATAQPVPAPSGPSIRPSPLTTRQSSSTLPSINDFKKAGQAGISADSEPVDQVIVASRRLSLAPGLGTGTSTSLSSTPPLLEAVAASPSGSPAGSARTSMEVVPTIDKPTPPPFGSKRSVPDTIPTTTTISTTISSGPPAFGAKRSSTMAPRASSGRRRPQTATPQAHGIAAGLVGISSSRASLAVPGGAGGSANRNRPGWEADEVVGTLRSNGLEVTVVRQATQLPSLLDPSSSSTIASTHIAKPNDPAGSLINVVLVPLSDSTSLPSLSLLLNQGTTPTAVCFQQDLLDRARKMEEEWLNKAVEQIKLVAEMRDKIVTSSESKPTGLSINKDSPVIVAYSANPNLSPTAVAACMAAGAAGVLKPPYNFDTAEAVRRVVQAHRDGTDLPSALLSPKSRVHSPALAGSSEMSIAEETTVVLPPTALSMGGEHEGEKVLSAMVGNNRRRSSTEAWNGDGPQAKRPSLSGPSGPSRTASQATSSSHDFGDHPYIADTFTYHQPDTNDRRRSVDVGGLSLALKRAQKVFELATPSGSNKPVFNDAVTQMKVESNQPGTPLRGGIQSSMQAARSSSNIADADFGNMEVAELLSAMYSQTMLTIQVQMSDYDELSAPLTPEHRARLVDQLSGWNFKPHTLAEGDLFRVACLLFEAILNTEGLVELKLERDQVNRLLFAIRAIYHAPNPYHNYVHAIDVLQATYTFLVNIGVAPPYSYMREWSHDKPIWRRDNTAAVAGTGTSRAREVISPQDVFAIIVAAMGHDVGHPGLSNAFMKNAKVPLSQVYEDKSVLENMHCMLIVQLLRKHGFQFLVEGPPSPSATVAFDQKGFRKVLYSSVLATDMSLHFAWIARLKEFDERLKAGLVGKPEDDRIMICQALIKCADISNPTRPIDVSQHWSSVLLEEWAKQASLEQDLDLPVSVVASADAALQAKGQIGFIDLFTQPLFEAVADALPEIQVYADSCAANRALWKGRLDELLSATETDGSESPQLIQPAIEGESRDERFKTLFPLLLPESLVAGIVDTTPSDSPPSTPNGGHDSDSGSSKFPGVNAFQPRTPEPERVREFSSPREKEKDKENQHSPASKAMRAVYHAKLVNQVKKSGLTSWSRGNNVGNGQYEAGRRMSTPEVSVTR